MRNNLRTKDKINLLERIVRLFRSKCPECEGGRLKKHTEFLGKSFRKGGFFHGMTITKEVEDYRKTIECDRCFYIISEKYEKEICAYIH